jgi:ABC-type transport system substrate-binding protein
MYDYLIDFRINPKSLAIELVPCLATDWQVEKGGRRYVFTLRKGVRFHDGSTFDATVAKWNLDRIRTDPKAYLKEQMGEVESVNVLDENTLAVNLKQPSGIFLYLLIPTYYAAGMVSKAFQERHGDDELARKGCGTGPFRYKHWTVDHKVTLERFPDYWQNGVDGKPLPYLDGLEENFRPMVEKAMIELRSGDLDTVIDPVEREVPTVLRDANLEYIKLPPSEWHKVTMGFNARRGPFTSHALRKAACYAIDRERIAKIVGFGVGRVHQYPMITKGQPGWAPEEWPDYSYNPDKAAELVKVDYPKGVTVELFHIVREPDNQFGQLIQAMWNKVGIKTELKSLERVAWIASMRKDTFQAAFFLTSPYPEGFIQVYLLSGAGANWPNISNPNVDKLLLEHSRTVDQSKRHELLKEALKIVYESAELTCVYAVPLAVATHKKVRGIRSLWKVVHAGEIWMSS